MGRGRIGIAIFLALLTACGVWQVIRIMRAPSLDQWVETPATVLKAKVVESYSRRGARERAEISYQYQFAGQAYTSSRIWLTTRLGSSMDSFDWVDVLAAAKGRGEQVPCYVNPRDPTEAILTREQSAWALPGGFALAIGGGLGLYFFVTRSGLFTYEAPDSNPPD